MHTVYFSYIIEISLIDDYILFSATNHSQFVKENEFSRFFLISSFKDKIIFLDKMRLILIYF